MHRIRDTLRGLKVLQGPFLPFDTDRVPDDPANLFLEWLETAIRHGVAEPHAMTLSTTDADGQPDARVLILKNVDANGWHFAISGASRKGRQIEMHRNVALTFYWQPLARQVRIRGPAIHMGEETSAADFLSRPLGSRIAALIGRQSDVLENEADFEVALAASARRVQQEPDLRFEFWRVYAVRAKEVEFWQGHPERRHQRLRYCRRDDSFVRERLWP